MIPAKSAPICFSAYPLEDYRAHRDDIQRALQRSLELGHYILGSEVAAFEQEFASFVGVAHSIGVANGTDAIELLLRALDIQEGSSVAVPSQTAVASVSAIVRAGATPLFVDVDPVTFAMLPESLDQAIHSPAGTQLKAVLAVHLYGHPAEMDELRGLCDGHNLILLEDCAQSHGAMYHGKPVGSIGRGAAFSFYPTKNLGAIGDGGAVATNDTALADKVRWLRQYGWRERYISDFDGINSRLDELQAAILRVKLPFLTPNNERRRSLAAIYEKGLRNLPIQTPVSQPCCEHAYHLYVIRAKQRDALMKYLTSRSIPTSRHYPAAVHQQPGYAALAQRSPPLPNTEALVPEILSLPLHPYLTMEAVKYTIDAIHDFFS
jgi:dTDP-4-amino-4,6-dideoxygalactose transaminase